MNVGTERFLEVYGRQKLMVQTGCEDRLRYDLYCVGWGVKLYSIQSNLARCSRT